MLCRNAISQGHTNSEYAKITEESWTYITEGMKDVCTADTITRTFKKVTTEVGLKYKADRDQALMQRLYVDTEESLVRLRSVVGGASVGYGVRKPRPRFDGTPQQRNIHMNDGVHVVNVWDNKSRMRSNDPGRKRIVLTYNREDDRVHVYVSYSLVVLSSEEAIIDNRLDTVGVVISPTVSTDEPMTNEEEEIPLDPNLHFIKKGEQFIYPFDEEWLNGDLPKDGRYLFRITEVFPQSGYVVARMLWKLDEDGVATKRLNPYSSDYLYRFEDSGPVIRAIQKFQAK